jgi:hypothetical protein
MIDKTKLSNLKPIPELVKFQVKEDIMGLEELSADESAQPNKQRNRK